MVFTVSQFDYQYQYIREQKMKQEYKTVSKYFLKETAISDEDTNYKHKSKSVAIKNQHTISLKSKQGMTQFSVYKDYQVGFGKKYEKHLTHLEADEDVETTPSVLEFGRKLCLKDLEEYIKLPKEQTEDGLYSQTQSSF